MPGTRAVLRTRAAGPAGGGRAWVSGEAVGEVELGQHLEGCRASLRGIRLAIGNFRTAAPATGCDGCCLRPAGTGVGEEGGARVVCLCRSSQARNEGR